MHGAGNDYLYFDCFDEPLKNPSRISRKLSDRHFSVGGDGIILIERSDKADAKMRIFNADGSEGRMCGNGIRCVGKFLYDLKNFRKNLLTIETKSGIRTLKVVSKNKANTQAKSFLVDMGRVELKPQKIPALFEGEEVVAHPFLAGDQFYRVTCVNLGNPHCVVFEEQIEKLDLEKIGPIFENHPAFPDRVNTEFVDILGKNELKMRVWERGSGETLACGTGACAASVAAVLNGLAEKDKDITVHLKGGILKIRFTNGRVFMTGPAQIAFKGEVEI